MRSLLLLLSTLFSCFSLLAQQTEPTYLLPTREGEKWGGVTSAGKVLAPPRFDYTEALSLHFLKVQQGEKYGLYAADGKQLLPPEAEQLLPLDSQFVAFRKDGKWGGCNPKKLSITAEFDTLIRLNSRFVACGKDGKFGLTRTDGISATPVQFDALRIADTLQPDRSDVFVATLGGEIRLLDKNGEVLSAAEKVFPTTTGLLFFTRDKRWGALRPDGKQVIENAYVRFSVLSEDFIALRGTSGDWLLFSISEEKTLTEEKYDYFRVATPERIVARDFLDYALLDKSGNPVLTGFQNIHHLGDNLFIAQKEEKWGLFRADGKQLLPHEYDFIYDLPPARQFTKIKQGLKEGLVSTTGEILLPTEYTSIEVYAEKVLAFRDEQLTVFRFTLAGKQLSKQEYDNLAEANFQLGDLRDRVFFNWTVQPRPRPYQWFQKNTTQHWMLINPRRQKVFPNEYDQIYTDPYTGLTRAKRLNEKGEITHCALVDSHEGKLLFEIEANDFEIKDFRFSNVARVILDTLKHDALVSKSGKLMTRFGEAQAPADSMGIFAAERIWVFAGNRYGYLDTAGNTAIPFNFSYAEDFQNGYAEVAKGDRHGFIRPDGSFAVAPAYDEVSAFRNGFAPVIQDKKYGLVNTKGELVIPTEYTKLSFARDGIVRAQRGRAWGVLSTEGETIVPFENAYVGTFVNGVAKIRRNGMYGFVRTDGSYLLKPSIRCNDIGQPENGIAWIGLEPYRAENDPVQDFYFKKYGYIKTNGEMLIPPEYSKITDFETIWREKKGVAQVEKEGKFGYVNHTGKVVVPAVYDKIGEDFPKVYAAGTGVCRVEQDGKVGYINHAGEVVFPLKYEEVRGFERIWDTRDRLCAVKKDGKWGAVDRLDNTVLKPQYDFVAMSPHNDSLALVRDGDRWGVINQFNQTKLPSEFDRIKYLFRDGHSLLETQSERSKFLYYDAETGELLGSVVAKETGDYGEGLIPAREGEKWGFHDGKDWKVEPQFEAAGKFSGGLAPVKIEGKWGYTDKDGTLKIPADYEAARAFSGKLAPVKQGGKWGLIATDGSVKLPFAHSEITPLSEAGYFRAGQRDDGTTAFALISPSGEELTKFDYLDIQPFAEGLAAAKINDRKTADQRYGYLDQRGKTVIGHEYQEVQAFSEGFAWVNLLRNGKWSLIDKSGEVLLKARYRSATPFSGGLSVVENRWIITPDDQRLHQLDDRSAEALGAFSEKTLTVKSNTGYYHLRTDGSPLYRARFDSVTQISAGRGFAQLGTRWGLRRLSVSAQGEVVTPFSTPAKLKYQSQYPKGRIQTTRYGDRFKDLGWEKLREGYFRLISPEGHYLNRMRYARVSGFGTPVWKAEVRGLFGVADLNGNWIAEPKYIARDYLPGNILRLETAEALHYLRIDGTWIFGGE